MTCSENTLTQKRMRKSIFRTSHTYHNCLLESSQLENPSVLTGWYSGILMANIINKSFLEQIIHILKSQVTNWGYIMIMPSSFAQALGF